MRQRSRESAFIPSYTHAHIHTYTHALCPTISDCLSLSLSLWLLLSLCLFRSVSLARLQVFQGKNVLALWPIEGSRDIENPFPEHEHPDLAISGVPLDFDLGEDLPMQTHLCNMADGDGAVDPGKEKFC